MVDLGTYEFKDLNTGKIKPKELFINYYDKEVYDYEHVRISTKVRNANVLFAILSLSLCTLFQKVSRFRKFLSNPCCLLQNPCFLRQFPMLPGVLSAVLCMVHAGGSLCGYDASAASYMVLPERSF